ncbi:MAG: hypothetical protein KC461_11685, partial [Dehalococcoidia bacterium]|nr:hypothetical protein [Dehalococcoidia bacterium]
MGRSGADGPRARAFTMQFLHNLGTRVGSVWDSLRESLWFLPAIAL